MLDTLAYTKHLEGAGVDRKLAEAHAEAMNKHILPDLVTKADVESALDKMTLRMVLANIGLAGIALAIAKLLP
jgi:hypothetical protein